jgi:hypothetical protein
MKAVSCKRKSGAVATAVTASALAAVVVTAVGAISTVMRLLPTSTLPKPLLATSHKMASANKVAVEVLVVAAAVQVTAAEAAVAAAVAVGAVAELARATPGPAIWLLHGDFLRSSYH